jgi:hypothetical protein
MLGNLYLFLGLLNNVYEKIPFLITVRSVYIFI